MQAYEYHIVPAPRRGEKAKGLKTTEARFAHALSRAINEIAAEGWEYLRTDTLPVEERVGLTGRTTTFQHMLVFRRPLTPEPVAVPPPVALAAPAPVAALPAVDTPDAESDPLDVAARRAALVARPEFGTAPRLSASAETGLAPAVGPARNGDGQAAE